ncbi:hypothetical protein [Streptomyces sp. NPDC101178]|uniref:hypothetical protein n=1 Tax=Streptomyces sp. NPDC101178 TaxID=3366124 RepID=UPI0038125D3E
MAMTYSSGSCDDLPEHAKPGGYLASLTATPTEWVTVLKKGEIVPNRFDWRISSYLTPPAAQAHALQDCTPTEAAIGSAGIKASA